MMMMRCPPGLAKLRRSVMCELSTVPVEAGRVMRASVIADHVLLCADTWFVLAGTPSMTLTCAYGPFTLSEGSAHVPAPTT